MDFPRKKEFQKISDIKNRNSKNESSVLDSKKGQFNDSRKNQILITKANKNFKIPIPILIHKNHNNNGKINNKFIKINNKDILIRALSYKTIENDNNIEKHKSGTNKYYINKKNNDSISMLNANKKIYNSFKILKENLTTDINNSDITQINEIFNNKEKINCKKDISININNNINTNDNIKNIVTSLTSKNRVFKRNVIPNLKNLNVFNKNTNNINNYSNKINKHDYSNITSSNNSTTNSNIKNNYIKEKLKIDSKHNSNLLNNFPGILSPQQNEQMNINKSITNYKNKIKQVNNHNKIINLNNNRKMGVFKNCRSQMFKNLDTFINSINGNDSSRSNYNKYNSTNSSYKKKVFNKIKSKIKSKENNYNKKIIIETKLKNKNLQKNITDRKVNNNGNSQLQNESVNILMNNNNNKSNIFENSKLRDMKKMIFNHKLNNIKEKKLIKKDKIFLLTNANNTLNSISNFKNKINQKNISNVGSFTSRLKNININKSNFNNFENSERLTSYKNLNESTNVSFIKKLGNKVNYLNINLNNWSNINNTTICNNNSNNTQNITIPAHINTINDNSFQFKKKLKNKFLKKQNDVFANKGLINSNNNIIILNNISMNNLNNISFDYLTKLNKNKTNYSSKNLDSMRKKFSSYASKEKDYNIIEKNKELEKKREYYNNQKKIHKKKNNYKKNNRIKEQNLNGFNLRQNNLIKNKKEIIKDQKFINHSKINSSVNFNHINKTNAQNEYIHKHHYSNNFNIMINTNKINTNNINVLNKNYSTSTNRPIFNLIKNLREKIKKEKEKIKINSELRSSKKLKSMETLPINNNSLNYLKQNKLNNKITKKNLKYISEYNNNLKEEKRIKKNCLSDVNEKIIEEIKYSNYGINTIYKDEIKEKEYSKNTYKSFSIDDKIKNKGNKIKIIKKKKNKLLNIINNLNESLEKNDKYIKKTNTDILKSHDILNSNENDKIKKPNPQQAEEYTTDIIESLLEEEDYYFNKKKYINPLYLENEDSELTPEMRTIAVDWLVLIHYKIFKFSENTLFLAIQIFDRYLSKVDLNTEQTELLLYTSFMLASKHNEIDYVNMQETLKLSQDKFNKEQIIKMESEILIMLDFEILAPTMCEFFVLFASFLNLNKLKINQGLYILNIILVDFHMLKYPNFMLAFSVIKLITKKVDKNLINLIESILKEKKLEKFLNIFLKDGCSKICKKIKLLYNTFLETKYKNIKEKFSDKEYNCVSTSINI